MKKFTLMALFAVGALLLHTPTWGQKFEVIINDGLNFSSLVGLDDSSSNVGIFSEIGVGYKFNDKLGVEVDVAWSEQGAMHSIGNNLYTYSYNYLNFPLLGTFNLPKHNLTIIAGVQAGCFLNAPYTYECLSESGDVILDSGKGYLESSKFRPWDFGATIGLRWLAVPELDLGFEVRYTRGLTPTHTGMATSTSNPSVIIPNNRNSVFRVGFYFLLW